MNKAHDASPRGHDAAYEDGIALYLPGPGSGDGVSPRPALTPSRFSGPRAINRAVHLAGGRIHAQIPLGGSYSIEMWFWNGLETSARSVTGYLFSIAGDHLSIGGTNLATGKLLFTNTEASSGPVEGRTVLQTREWHHLVVARNDGRVTVYLDGHEERSGKTPAIAKAAGELFIGGSPDNVNNFEGKLDEVAIYDRALRRNEVETHYRAAALRQTQ